MEKNRKKIEKGKRKKRAKIKEKSIKDGQTTMKN